MKLWLPILKKISSSIYDVYYVRWILLIRLRVITNLFLAAITYFLVYKASIASMNSDEFINDPRHPRFAQGGKFIDLEKRD